MQMCQPSSHQTYIFLHPIFYTEAQRRELKRVPALRVKAEVQQEEYPCVCVIKDEEISTNQSDTTDLSNKKGKGHAWSESEVSKLVSNYKKYNGNWGKVVKHLRGRNISQCSQKYRKLMDQERRTKKKWTHEEDKQLLKAFDEFGKQWMKIAECLPSRTCKQVRDRYINKLDPLLNTQQWNDDEDNEVIRLYKEMGPRWTFIAKHLNNRSENQVKNRFYYSIQKKFNGEPHPYLKIEQ